MRAATLLPGLAACLAGVNAISTLTTKGSKFFTSDGDQFFVRGVAYQLTPDDPLVNGDQCKLDATLMQTLGANSIRVYHVDASGDHKACMSTFADAKIYVWIDLDTFDTQIDQDSPHWDQSQLDAFQKVMDEFVQYDNTAGFFVGNEVLTKGTGSVAAPFVKAAARDLKAYRDSKKYRPVPVGYSAADISSLRPMLQNYMACGSNASESLDFFSLNAYEWCGQSSYETSGYSQLTEDAANYNIPIFLSETGCNTPKPRTFDDQAAIFGDQMSGVWSGAIIYEWIEEANDYGLISYGQGGDGNPNAPDGFLRSGTPTPVSPDFSNLANQWKTVSPSAVKAADYNPTVTPPPCPAFTSDVWNVNGAVALPTVGHALDASAQSSITKGTAAGGSATGSASASTSPTKTGGASPARKVTGMGAGLLGVLVGVFWWL